jgi:hypothetical protein
VHTKKVLRISGLGICLAGFGFWPCKAFPIDTVASEFISTTSWGGTRRSTGSPTASTCCHSWWFVKFLVGIKGENIGGRGPGCCGSAASYTAPHRMFIKIGRVTICRRDMQTGSRRSESCLLSETCCKATCNSSTRGLGGLVGWCDWWGLYTRLLSQ